MITLRIFVMGLVALVPETNFQAGPQKWTVLLQDERGASCMRHVPVLIYDRDARICPDDDPGCDKIGDGHEIAAQIGRAGQPSPGLLLNGEEIHIANMYGQKAPGEGVLMAAKGKSHWWESWIGAVPHSQTMGSDVKWFPRLRDIIPGSSEVRRSLLIDYNPKGLAGRFSLADGTLSTFSLADVRGQIRSMTFRPLGSKRKMKGVKQAVTDVALFTVNVNAPEVRIMLREFASDGKRELILGPNKNGEVNILLGNLTPLKSKFDREAPAEHFSLFTKLSTKPKMAFEAPVPHLGWSAISVEREDIETAVLPTVIQSVNQYVAQPKKSLILSGVGASGGEAGTNRPICTVAVMDAPLPQTNAGGLIDESTIPDVSAAQASAEESSVELLKQVTLDEAYKIALKFISVEEVTGVERCEDSSGATLRFNVQADTSTEDILKRFLGDLGVGIRGPEGLNRSNLPFKVEFSRVRYRIERAASIKVEEPTDEWRPLRPGASIGVKNNGPGTLGLFVKAKKDDYFVSAAHVVDSVGKKVCQPEEDLQACGTVGKVTALQLEEVDAALVKIGSINIDRRQLNNEVVIGEIGEAACGNIVEKSSRSTFVTKGRIAGIGEYEVELDDVNSITIEGFSIVPIEPGNPDDEEISLPGDSGAAWYLPKNSVSGIGVGLHVAGEVETEKEKELAIASNLCRVLKILKVLKDNGMTVACQ